MKKWLFLFSVCALYLNATPFYQNPSLEAAYQWLHSEEITQVPEEDKPFSLSLATTFIAQVIKVHPEYIESFAKDFARLSPIEKSILFQAFSTMGIQDSRVQGTEICQMMPLSELDHLEFKTGHDFDLMVVSFLATGDEIFLSQPMAFLNSDPELLFFTYEWYNRQALTEFLKELTGQTELPDQAEFLEDLRSWPEKELEQLVLRLAAWQCLNFIGGEDPTAEAKISQLGKNNPELDYLGTLQKFFD